MMAVMTSRTTVYTDGACSGNPGPGGWAWIVPDGPFAAGGESMTTNQRMELTAALDAVQSLPGPLEIVSDSSYVVNCFKDGWYRGWLKRGWKNSQNKPVANQDLWQPLIEEFLARKDTENDIRWTWVKGHSNDTWNDYADRLAVEAGSTQQPRRGDSTPDTIGEPDEPKIKRASSDEVPDGHRIIVTGHRPPELGGYDDNPLGDAVRNRLVDIIAAHRSLHPDLVILTGMGLGAETMAAEAAHLNAVPYVAVLAYPEFEAPWPAPARTRFNKLLEGAETTITLQKRPPENKQKAGAAHGRRDGWLRRHADQAIVVWNRSDGPVARMVKGLESEVGEENVWIIDPNEL